MRTPITKLPRLAWWLVVAAVAFAGGCGLPADGAVRTIRSSDVPYDLLDPAPPTTSPSTVPSIAAAPQPETYLLDVDHGLVPVPTGFATSRSLVGPTSSPAPTDSSQAAMTARTILLVKLLATLERGPTPQQRAQGLGTALTSGVTIRLLSVRDTMAEIEVQSAFKEPAADRLPLAIGQMVLTATSVPGIEVVQLVRDGIPLEVPLPGGALTAEPLHRKDYAVLITRLQ